MGIFMRFPAGKAKAFTMSYDDGVVEDIRLMKIMDGHGLKGTFNLNSGLFGEKKWHDDNGNLRGRLAPDEAVKLYTGCGHEVACHALTHPFLEQLTPERCTYEVIKDRQNLEEMFGGIVKGMAYPFGTFSDDVVASLRSCGIVYSRTTLSSHDFGIPRDWLRLKPTCHHTEAELMPLGKRFAEEKPNRAPWLFYLWGHSYEFDVNSNWALIENFAEYIGGREDVWYATNMQICRYVKAFGLLEFGAEGKTVRNPSDQTLYFEADGKNVKIESGAEKLLADCLY
jgi:peptidoglycan-N-acetylglucosamine deacetylase